MLDRPRNELDGDWIPHYAGGDRLLRPSACRWCSQPVRVADVRGRTSYRLRVQPDPVEPSSATNPRWPAWWWDDVWGLISRVWGHDSHHTHQPLYVLHPCEDRHHRPATRRPVTPPPTPAPPQEEDRMTAPTFATPGTPGEGVKNDDLQGKLLLITVTEKRTGITTSAGVADALATNIVELDGPSAGTEHSDNLLFGKVLFGQLAVGTTYLGRIGKGVAQPGKSAPWLFTGAETDPAAVDVATKYLAYKAGQAPAPAPAAQPTAAPFPPTAPAAASSAPPWAA